MKAFARVVVPVVLLGLIAAACIAPRSPPAPPRQTKLHVPILGFRMINGLRVVLVPDPRATTIDVSMRYHVGAIDDPRGREGMAHLVEHLMFQQVVEGHSLAERVASTTTWFNATTDLDATTYMSRALPAQLEHVLTTEGMRLGLRCTTISDPVFAREREVVRNELVEQEQIDQLRGALFEALYPAGHPYHRRVGGSRESVAAITRAEACAFIDAHYSPDNAVLVIAGNVTVADVDAAAGKLLGRVARRQVAAPIAVPPATAVSHREVRAPVDRPRVVIAWPLADEPDGRARSRAIATMLADLVDYSVKGSVGVIELGGELATKIGLHIVPAQGETPAQALNRATQAIRDLPSWLEADTFEQARQRAAYQLFVRLEQGMSRDDLLAAHVLAGRDPADSVMAELDGLSRLTRTQARSLARRYFAFEAASVVTLLPADATTSVRVDRIDEPIHARGLRPVATDPGESRVAARSLGVADPFAGVRSRKLANGLRVILMPLTSVPTIDVRLVFAVGTGDEPRDRRGIAMIAGRWLWPSVLDNRILTAFAGAGGSVDVEVDIDSTTFAVHGFDMHVDVLLAGLERHVRGGGYSRALSDHLRTALGKRAAAPFDDVWQRAMFGDDHPYVGAGSLRHMRLDALDADAVDAFRNAHYRPDAATLIIAGGFDPELADRWVDYLFGDWSGRAAIRHGRAATLQPVALARYRDAPQVELDIAIPVRGAAPADAARPLAMIAAAMIEDAVADVRHQLGASYGLQVGLVELRLATVIGISGKIATDRVPEAVALIRDRLVQLAGDNDAIASAFVAARRRVMTKLSVVEYSAGGLAALTERSVVLGGDVTADLATAERARQLTLGDLAGLLGGLDLAKCAVQLRGPQPAVDQAFHALGLTPRLAGSD